MAKALASKVRWEMVVGVAFCAFVCAAAVLARYVERKQWRMKACASNLKSLGYASHLYADDNDGEFPSDPGALLAGYATDTRIFVPPGTDAVVFNCADLSPGANDASGALGPEHTHYGFVSGLYADEPHYSVYMFCKTSHPGGKRNVLFIGGNVERRNEEELNRLLETTLREARAAGRDAKVWGVPAQQPVQAGAPAEAATDGGSEAPETEQKETPPLEEGTEGGD